MGHAIRAIWILLLLWAPAHAGSPVWEISKGNQRLFIGGTVHVLGQADYPLPKAFDRAYAQSLTLVFETDIARTRTEEFGQALMEKMVYPGNRTLKSMVRPATFEALSGFAAARGIPVANLERFKPGMVMVFLTLAETERLGVDGIGVDEFYFNKGKADGRPMAFLESPLAQIRFLSEMGRNKEDEILTYILKDIGDLPRLLPVIKQAWRSGDNDLLYRETLAPMKKEHPQIFHALMVERNLAWLPIIQKMLTTPEVEFILVGAGHLAGDRGLLALLREKGYTALNIAPGK